MGSSHVIKEVIWVQVVRGSVGGAVFPHASSVAGGGSESKGHIETKGEPFIADVLL